MEIIDSARKHGITDDNIRHATTNATKQHDFEDGFVLVIGPAADGTILEIGINTETETVVHAMQARPKFL